VKAKAILMSSVKKMLEILFYFQELMYLCYRNQARVKNEKVKNEE